MPVFEVIEISSLSFFGLGLSHKALADESWNSLPDFSKGLNFHVSSHDLDETASTHKMSCKIAKH